jgi:hypothetical protein
MINHYLCSYESMKKRSAHMALDSEFLLCWIVIKSPSVRGAFGSGHFHWFMKMEPVHPFIKGCFIYFCFITNRGEGSSRLHTP